MRRRPVRPTVPQAGEGRIDAEPPRSEEGRPQGLAHDQYTDVDMVNAHPAILSQLFLKLGLACPALERYVDEREAVLAETGLGRDEAKQAFLT